MTPAKPPSQFRERLTERTKKAYGINEIQISWWLDLAEAVHEEEKAGWISKADFMAFKDELSKLHRDEVAKFTAKLAEERKAHEETETLRANALRNAGDILREKNEQAAAHDVRVTELLAANTAEVERRREAEDLARRRESMGRAYVRMAFDIETHAARLSEVERERDAAIVLSVDLRAEVERFRGVSEQPTCRAIVHGDHGYPGIVNGEFHFTSDCPCGAWMGGSGSGAPTGIDPFGACPESEQECGNAQPCALHPEPCPRVVMVDGVPCCGCAGRSHAAPGPMGAGRDGSYPLRPGVPSSSKGND